MIVGEETGALFITVIDILAVCKEIRLDTSILCNTLKLLPFVTVIYTSNWKQIVSVVFQKITFLFIKCSSHCNVKSL